MAVPGAQTSSAPLGLPEGAHSAQAGARQPGQGAHPRVPRHPPVEEEQNGKHGLVDVAVADALVVNCKGKDL